jgi:hypothetical protein
MSVENQAAALMADMESKESDEKKPEEIKE